MPRIEIKFKQIKFKLKGIEPKDCRFRVILKLKLQYFLIFNKLKYANEQTTLLEDNKFHFDISGSDLKSSIVEVKLYLYDASRSAFKSKNLGEIKLEFQSWQKEGSSGFLDFEKVLDSKPKAQVSVKYQLRGQPLPQKQIQKRPLELEQQKKEEQFNKQQIESIDDQIVELKVKLGRYEAHIERLTDENGDLESEIKEKKKILKMNRHLNKDKVKVHREKLEKTEAEYIKVKQTVARVFNLINSTGDIELIERVQAAMID